MIPSIERIAIAYLNARDDVEAEVVTDTPDDTGPSWVRVSQIDPKILTPNADEHFGNYMIQFDCYAGKDAGKNEGQEVADLLTRTVRAALKDMRNHTHTGAVVTDVDFTSCPRLPDGDFEPAMERYALTAEIFAHAA